MPAGSKRVNLLTTHFLHDTVGYGKAKRSIQKKTVSRSSCAYSAINTSRGALVYCARAGGQIIHERLLGIC